ncbi:MAG: hypothetical protein L6R36_000241 [Xanthoria steineri]|nr:MAG: hypothetical protein L6R36_000241 [Xanthoria steineri]
MRLINVHTFDMENGHEPDGVKYAILSHKWFESEISFQDFQNLKDVEKANMKRPHESLQQNQHMGIGKIAWSASIARKQGLNYIWIDTCCIDKTSSAELSESINSMWKWYRLAVECYAYLPDVDRQDIGSAKEELEDSVWFKRGWTLQELLAPPVVRFYDRHWKSMATKADMASDISSITKISPEYLGGDLRGASIATKMSWVAKRTTTKLEDIAYCLLGIFGLNMDLRYGEGNQAFIRLQKELVENCRDESIFAWTNPDPRINVCGLLAPEPACFAESGDITHLSKKAKQRPSIVWSSAGIRIAVPVFFWDLQNGRDWNNLAVATWRNLDVTLNCWRIGESKSKDTVTIHLKKTKEKGWQRNRCGELSLTRDRGVLKCYDVFGNPKLRVLTVEQ